MFKKKKKVGVETPPSLGCRKTYMKSAYLGWAESLPSARASPERHRWLLPPPQWVRAQRGTLATPSATPQVCDEQLQQHTVADTQTAA